VDPIEIFLAVSDPARVYKLFIFDSIDTKMNFLYFIFLFSFCTVVKCRIGNSMLNRAYADFQNPLFKYTTEKVLEMMKNKEMTFEAIDKPLFIY